MPPESKQRKSNAILPSLTTPGLYLIIFAICGWFVLIANMFGIAGKTGWIFPEVQDIAGLAASTVFLALLGLTPLAIKQLFTSGRNRNP